MVELEKKPEITDAEFEIMKVLWAKEQPLSVQDICDELLHKNWKYSTVATLLGRMKKKGIVEGVKSGYAYYYTPLTDEKEYKKSQTRKLISKLYDGSAKKLIASLYSDNEMSAEDIAELKNYFDLN
ncbi:BlaI transcriptional regulatory family [Syntrophomonas zehnderi OL-4]|uniref:BlaI transcriptional regulatory family n=1 Tax=Syntrophomonas zehnderi OL-4 TaxID=690567 RepID=A0A0E4GBX4_9FIRM|nr:BlaI/MecI/CopY family transcriptional regulator [Syntrophomonas zehnderi]CFY01924.1 BlaI transcriptional regulatory family [Syntrophomonas zehnderi OL-4]